MHEVFEMSMLGYFKYDEVIKSSFFKKLSKIIGNNFLSKDKQLKSK
jgi:hypothetical protein